MDGLVWVLWMDKRFCVCYGGGYLVFLFFFFQAEDGIRDDLVTGVQTCALPISRNSRPSRRGAFWREFREPFLFLLLPVSYSTALTALLLRTALLAGRLRRLDLVDLLRVRWIRRRHRRISFARNRRIRLHRRRRIRPRLSKRCRQVVDRGHVFPGLH